MTNKSHIDKMNERYEEEYMKKFVPFEKLSKKQKREQYAARRGSWGPLNPVTRKPGNPKAYNRNKARKRRDDMSVSAPY